MPNHCENTLTVTGLNVEEFVKAITVYDEEDYIYFEEWPVKVLITNDPQIAVEKMLELSIYPIQEEKKMALDYLESLEANSTLPISE